MNPLENWRFRPPLMLGGGLSFSLVQCELRQALDPFTPKFSSIFFTRLKQCVCFVFLPRRKVDESECGLMRHACVVVAVVLLQLLQLSTEIFRVQLLP